MLDICFFDVQIYEILGGFGERAPGGLPIGIGTSF
jgi:hypothetical protein